MSRPDSNETGIWDVGWGNVNLFRPDVRGGRSQEGSAPASGLPR